MILSPTMKLERDTYIGAVTAIAYSPDGKYIVCGNYLKVHTYVQEAVHLYLYTITRRLVS